MDMRTPQNSVSRTLCAALVFAYLALLPALGEDEIMDPETRPVAEVKGEVSQAPKGFSGIVPASLTRTLRGESNPKVAGFLRYFVLKKEDFEYKARLIKSQQQYDCYDVIFLSPVKSDCKENNRVWCEYYRPRTTGKQPGVIVLHILDGKFVEARVICDYLASVGCHSMLVKMPYYGERRPKDGGIHMTQDAETMMKGLHQAVQDVRRAASFLASQETVDPNRIGVCGVSLGAFVTGLVSGVDGGFGRSVMILGGGDLAGMIMHGPKEIKAIADSFKAEGFTYETLRDKFAVVAPLTYSGRIPPGSLLMLNGRQDEVVPAANAETFWKATRGQPPIVWYDCTHYSAIQHMLSFLTQLSNQFSPEKWQSATPEQ